MSCPGGTSLQGNLCQQNCPSGYFVDQNFDVSTCQQGSDKDVSATCLEQTAMTGSQELPNNPTLCTKGDSNPIAATSPYTCPQGFIQQNVTGEAQPNGQCQQRCPAQMVENGTTCQKKLQIRSGIVPVCTTDKIWNGSSCISVNGNSSSGLSSPKWFYIALIALLGAFVLSIYEPLLDYVSNVQVKPLALGIVPY